MRDAFIEELLAIAEIDPRVWLLCGDLGYSVLEPFAEKFPDRYVNVGVAEQNMIGVAAGLALAGAVPFVYSIANFPVTRCLEQIRNDVCYHNLPVRIVAVGGGLTYASHGYTHHGVEDLATMRVLPHMTVVAPGDPHETRAALRALVTAPGPAYLRLGRAGEPMVHDAAPDFALGRALTVREGGDAAIIATGTGLKLAVDAADALARAGHRIRVISMVTVAPLDVAMIHSAAATGNVITVEEHGHGGLADAVAQELALMGTAVRFKAVRLRREPIKIADSHTGLRARHGLTVEDIVAAVTGD